MGIKPKRRNPKTARCWYCNGKYNSVYNEHEGIWGYCAACDSIQGIVAPSIAKEMREHGK